MRWRCSTRECGRRPRNWPGERVGEEIRGAHRPVRDVIEASNRNTITSDRPCGSLSSRSCVRYCGLVSDCIKCALEWAHDQTHHTTPCPKYLHADTLHTVECSRARNKLFTSATEAFRRGQGKVARDLARRGRELNAEMKEKHRQAASAIFSARNPADQVY